MEQNKERLFYLDGLRGFAISTIVLANIVISLFPSIITLAPSDTHSSFDILLGVSPLAFLWNSDFGLCIFTVLSGYVLSYFCNRNRISFPAKLLQRYLRLAIPVLMTSIVAWALLAADLYGNSPASQITRSGWLGSWYHFAPHFFQMAKEALWGAFVSGTNTYNPNILTINLAITGSVYVFILHTLFKDREQRLAVLLIFGVFYAGDYYLLFVAGAFLYDHHRQLVALLRRDREWIALSLAVLGLLLGSLPAAQSVDPQSLHGIDLTALLPAFQNAGVLHRGAAVALFIGLLSSPTLQRWFEWTFLVYLGRLSFMIYLIEVPIICSVLSGVVIYFPDSTPYFHRAGVAAGVAVIAIFIISAGLNRIFELRIAPYLRAMSHWVDRLFNDEDVSSAEIPAPQSPSPPEREVRSSDVTPHFDGSTQQARSP